MEIRRYIGLDIGTKRIGVAVTDPLFISAQPLKTIDRMPEKKSIEEIDKICKEYNVSLIVAGLPKNMDGSIGFQAENVMAYTELLHKSLNIETVFEDERLTSKDAERILREQNKKPSRNKGLIDVTSAVIILQQYLNRRR